MEEPHVGFITRPATFPNRWLSMELPTSFVVYDVASNNSHTCEIFHPPNSDLQYTTRICISIANVEFSIGLPVACFPSMTPYDSSLF